MQNILRWCRKPLPYRTYKYNICTVFIVVNIVIFILTQFGWGNQLHGLLALNPQLFFAGRYWTLITYMFDHANISHLLFNMLALYFFGTVVERIWGSNEFILLYVLIGVLAAVFSLIVYVATRDTMVFLLGASGAIYGVMLIFACMYPEQKIYIFGVFPVTAKVLMLIFIGMQLLFSFSGSRYVAYLTHLSGIGIAWLYLLLRHNINPRQRLFRR